MITLCKICSTVSVSLNIFQLTALTLQTIQSAIPSLNKLIADLKSAYAHGEVKPIKVLEEWIFTKVKSLFNSVTKITVLPLHFKRKKLLHQVWIN